MGSEAVVQIFDGPGRDLRRAMHPIPSSLANGEILVEIRLATICGSDLHTMDGHRSEPAPSILGHEAIGVIIELGPQPQARAQLTRGDRITWSIADSCGHCAYCTEFRLPEKCSSLFKYGHASLDDGSGLNGTYASHIVLRPGTHVVPLPDTLSDSVAAPVNCALATTVNAVSHVPSSNGAVVVQGAGILGLYTCALLHERGVQHLFCVDVDKRRLALVPQFGAIPIDGREDRYPQARRQIEEAAPHGVDAVIELAGSSSLVADGIRLLRPGGYYGFVGMVHPDTELNLTGEQVIRKCLTIQGVHNYSPHHLDEAVSFLDRTAGSYPYESLVSPPYQLNHIMQAVQTAQERLFPRIAVGTNTT